MTDKSWAIYSDLSGVGQVARGEGAFTTELAAIDRLIERLEGERARIAEKITKAKRRRRALAPVDPKSTDKDSAS